MLCRAALIILLASALPALAQSVTPVSDSVMLFSDPAFGVSFKFPTGWSFSKVEPNSGGDVPLAIAYADNRTVSTGLRGLVANETIPGIRSWPHTVFSSVQFGYDALERRLPSDASAQVSHLDPQLSQHVDPDDPDKRLPDPVPLWRSRCRPTDARR